MIVLLLIIIACVLLFGKDETKNGIISLIAVLFILGLVGMLASACGFLD